jgi:hypothetical protein
MGVAYNPPNEFGTIPSTANAARVLQGSLRLEF